MPSNTKSHIINLSLSEPDGDTPSSIIQKDRAAAMRDLMKDSLYQPVGDENGPYTLALRIEDNRLVFQTTCMAGNELPLLVLSLTPYRRIIKDYFMIVRSYDEALRDGKPSRIEAIDMGRRGLHNEGASLLLERLEGKIKMDLATARRLFTLICVLHSGKVHVGR